MSSFVFETRMWNRYNYSLFVVMIKQISNKIFNYFIQKLIKWFIRFWGFLFHENYSINQATNKSKISVMENKRLSTIASLTKLIKCCEVFFNGCRACVLTLKNVCFQSNLVFTLLALLQCVEVFPFKRKAAGSLFWKFSKRSEQDLNQKLSCWFLSVPHAALLIVCWSTSLQNIWELFLSVKRCYVFASVIWWMEGII